MIFEYFPVGIFAANCYIVGCEETKEAAVIDPGDEPDKILRTIRGKGLTVTCIINTHGHVDHVAANGDIKKATGAPILIHEQDAQMLTGSAIYLSLFGLPPLRGPAADRTLKDGETIQVGTLMMEVIHTPGHSPGGICLKIGDSMVITGDTLFAGSIGRTDFPGGSYATLINSIKERILPLGDDVTIYPGHGPASTIADEKAYNPFLLSS